MRLDIPSKLSAAFFILLCGVLMTWQVNAALFLTLASLGLVVQNLSRRKKADPFSFERFLLTMSAFIFLITVLNSIFLREGTIVATPLGVPLYSGGMDFGLRTSFRLAVISSGIVLFFALTPIREFLQFLQHTKVPPSLVVILYLSLHFVGRLPNTVTSILTAQESRGAPVRSHFFARSRALVSIVAPLILASIIETLERGAALEARGFRGHLARQSRVGQASAWSRFLTVAFLIASLALVILSILT